MITVQDLEMAIAECQGQRNPNANTCIKLAAYYTILRHMQGDETKDPVQAYSFAAQATLNSDTEFAQKVNASDLQQVLEVIDDLMTALAVLNPKLYESVMRKL